MRLKNKDSILQKLVFQIRYRYGFTYLDKCGRTINTIMRELSEWITRGEATPHGTGLVSLRNGCLFNFSSSEYGLSLEKPSGEIPLSDNDVKEFTEQVVSLSSLVNDQLGLREFTRIGFRAWYLYGCSSKDESEKWLNELGLFSINEKLSSAFNGELETTNIVVVISGADRKYRIAFNGVESHANVDAGQEILNVKASSLSKRQNQFLIQQMKAKRRLLANPQYAAMIDLDAFQEDPVSIDPQDFIETSFTNFSHYLLAAIEK